MPELKEILERYVEAEGPLNYAIKIVGHPGIGKSDAVRQTAREKNLLFMDTRLAFKENVDLGGYPVPDHEKGRMIYYRPKFIPPREVPEGYEGILWFLDEANRAHPTVIQTLFQIITERVCGEHVLPERTFIVLAGNLGEEDETVVTEFDDSALDGRLAIFHLLPDAASWLSWARREDVHETVIRYIAANPERLWDESMIHPNPRGWHQVSQALTVSYGLKDHEALRTHLLESARPAAEKVISALVGTVACRDFMLSVTAARELTASQVLSGDEEKLKLVRAGEVAAEDVFWALSGVLEQLRKLSEAASGDLSGPDLAALSNTLRFVAVLRADLRVSFFHRLVRQCGLFSCIPKALALWKDAGAAGALADEFGRILESP